MNPGEKVPIDDATTGPKAGPAHPSATSTQSIPILALSKDPPAKKVSAKQTAKRTTTPKPRGRKPAASKQLVSPEQTHAVAAIGDTVQQPHLKAKINCLESTAVHATVCAGSGTKDVEVVLAQIQLLSPELTPSSKKTLGASRRAGSAAVLDCNLPDTLLT